MENRPKIGFTCAYTPLSLIDAAGYSPYRILPIGDAPDQAGHILHDNLCPNIKRILDRALSNELPDLEGAVFINSCDAMRRMADAWSEIRKNEKTILLDLPSTADDLSISFFKNELLRVKDTLCIWNDKSIEASDIEHSIDKFNKIAQLLLKIAKRFRSGALEGGAAELQKVYNLASTSSSDDTLAHLNQLLNRPDCDSPIQRNGVPLYLFGNVLPDPEAFSMIESCGAFIANDDFCTGNRMFTEIKTTSSNDVFLRLAKALLQKQPCARTFDPKNPGKIAGDVLNSARAVNARGVIGYTVKFCDPYLERLPLVRQALRDAGIPLLLLEGDCTLRTIGQQKTRIEAFIEMLR